MLELQWDHSESLAGSIILRPTDVSCLVLYTGLRHCNLRSRNTAHRTLYPFR